MMTLIRCLFGPIALDVACDGQLVCPCSYADTARRDCISWQSTRLIILHVNICELLKVVIERRNGNIFGDSSRRDNTVYEMSLYGVISQECVQMNRKLLHFDAGAGNQNAEHSCNVGTRMLVKRFK